MPLPLTCRTSASLASTVDVYVDGAKCADLCRKHGMSKGTFYNRKAKFGGMTVSEARRQKPLKDENAKLKRLLTEQMLDLAAMKGLVSKKVATPAVRREAVAHLKALLGLSERRACRTVRADRKMVRYEARAVRRTRCCAIGCGKRRRFGYRRLFVLLRCDVLFSLRTGPFEAGVFGWHFLGGRGAENDEGIAVHESARQAFVLKQGEEGTLVAEVCRKAGISQATGFNWSKEDQ